MAEYMRPDGISDETALEIIEHQWYVEATNYREAGLCLRNPDYYNRAEALRRRTEALEHSDALLDAANEIRAGLGHSAVEGASHV